MTSRMAYAELLMEDTVTPVRILACAAQGPGSDDESRLRTLLEHFDPTLFRMDRAHKLKSFLRLLRALISGQYDLFVLEGTGLAAGAAAIFSRLLFGRRYVLSSGDAVGPFLAARMPLAAPVFHLYERLLYRCCAGFVGWTPYLVGRALTFGAPSAITCAGWAPYDIDPMRLYQARIRIRASFNIPPDAVVFGIAGTLVWSPRWQYCYGLELVRALCRSTTNAYVLIVGDGSGLEHLKQAAGNDLGQRIFFTGRVPREQVPEYLAAMDVGSLPQSTDQVGSFRYSTKIAEYRSVGLPFISNRIPMAYDLECGDMWRLPGHTPWSEEFIDALSILMQRLTKEAVDDRRKNHAPLREFDREANIARFTAFLRELVGDPATLKGRG